jgi:anthranilate synthase component 2
MIALIDNYDSFTFNLYQYLSEFAETKVFRNDEITVNELKALDPKGIVISPGPGVPEDAGISIEVIKKLGDQIPILGICLGHQSIATAYGGKVIRANEIFHGKTSRIQVKGKDIFEAARFGNVVGALSVTKLGTAPAMPYRKEIDDFCKQV